MGASGDGLGRGAVARARSAGRSPYTISRPPFSASDFSASTALCVNRSNDYGDAWLVWLERENGR